MQERTDILIAGGGIAGLTAACAFGSAGYGVTLVDPAPPVTTATDPQSDLRTTAFLQPSIPVLQAAGLWEALAPQAMPLQVMRIVDAGGTEPIARVSHDFDASDVSDQPFGWNLPNWLLRREAVARLNALPNVSFRPGVAARGLLTRDTEAIVTLSDRSRVRAQLLIAADGRHSPMRKALGIAARTTRYGQKALAFAVTHPEPHGNVSTEIHRTGGPFTLVPLPDRDGKPCSAVVWMDTDAEIDRIKALDDTAFHAEMNARSAGLFGPLTRASALTTWPIITQRAERLTGQRSVLMAEAAHVLPPIGAQGLNMSMADLKTLLDLASPQTLGSAEMLDAYARTRSADIRVRLLGIDLLNRASMLSPQPLRDARAAVLNALYSMAPVRKGLMQLGMGMR